MTPSIGNAFSLALQNKFVVRLKIALNNNNSNNNNDNKMSDK